MAHRAVFHATFKEKETLCATFGEVLGITPNPYTGELVITPKAHEQTTLPTAHKTMPGDVVVLEVPYYETHNDNNGLTAYIASEV